MKAILINTTLLLALLVSSCERQDNDNKDEAIELSANEAALRSSVLVNENTNVTAVRFAVSACEDPQTVFTEDRPLEDQFIPENIEELADNSLDKESKHLFADFSKVVPPGCYNINAVPLTESGETSELCDGASKEDVMVEAGLMTEVFLMIQCDGDDPGGIDSIVAINRGPNIDEVVFDDSKFICGSAGEVCASAVDVNGDPLEFDLEAPDFCDVEQIEEPYGDTTEGVRACWEIACRKRGKADLAVRVFDQAWHNAELIRIEDWLAEEGYPSESHTTLEFHAYFDGVRYYPDLDEDNFGDVDEPPWLVCSDETPPENYVNNNDDCDDQNAQEYHGTSCDDGLFCMVNDMCMNGECAGDQLRDCSEASDQCNIGICNEELDQCVPQPANNGGTCNDGDACTINDRCSTGTCSGEQMDCGHGSCSGGSCHCDSGWSGPDCRIQEVPISWYFSDVGNWRLVDGDCDMDTDSWPGGGDEVPVEAILRLRVVGNKLQLDLYFYTAEHGGDHTTFEEWHYHTVYNPGSNGTLLGIVGETECHRAVTSIGQNHSWTPFLGWSCDIVSGLQFRIDSEGDDCGIVGLRGTINTRVRVQW
jgi:hypothetical protein